MGAEELAEFGGVTLELSPDSAFTAPDEIARVTQIQLNDSYDVQSIDDFDAAAGQIIDQVTGARTVGVTFGTNLVPSDPGYQALLAAKKGNTRVFLRLTAVDTKASVTTRTFSIGGKVSQLNESYNKPAATTDIAFVGDEILSDHTATV